MPGFLTRRHGTCHFVRRVPIEFAAFDVRGIYTQSFALLDGFFRGHLPGLLLRVSWGGAKQWRVLEYVKVPDKENPAKLKTIHTSHPLGRYPALTLETARAKAHRRGFRWSFW